MTDHTETAGVEGMIDDAARVIHAAISIELGNTTGSEPAIADLAAARALGRQGLLADPERRVGPEPDVVREQLLHSVIDQDGERLKTLTTERDQLQARYEELSLKIGVDAGREYVRALKLQARIDKALEQHARDTDGSCKGCGFDAYEEPIPWPCSTARALQGDQPAEPARQLGVDYQSVRICGDDVYDHSYVPTEPAPDLDRADDAPSPVAPCPEGYHYIGQRLTHCSECGLPPWEHAGSATLPEGASPFGSGGWVLKPWMPGEADRFRERVLGDQPASASTVDCGEAVAESVAYCGYATDEPPAPFVPAADAFTEVTDG